MRSQIKSSQEREFTHTLSPQIFSSFCLSSLILLVGLKHSSFVLNRVLENTQRIYSEPTHSTKESKSKQKVKEAPLPNPFLHLFLLLSLLQMRTIMAKTPHDSSFSFSRRHFNWRAKKIDDDEEGDDQHSEEDKPSATAPVSRKKLQSMAVARWRSVLIAFRNRRAHLNSGLGSRVVGTLFGYRRGHVHFAFQEDSKASPAFMIELATPTSGLVREMASGLVRIALECDKKVEKKGMKILEEPLWRTYCNGKKCGFAMKRECGPEELRVLKALEPISMGAGVLPGNGEKAEGELMYMRAKFERVVGSRDSEAFYMMNPDSTGCPELSLYLLRV